MWEGVNKEKARKNYENTKKNTRFGRRKDLVKKGGGGTTDRPFLGRTLLWLGCWAVMS